MCVWLRQRRSGCVRQHQGDLRRGALPPEIHSTSFGGRCELRRRPCAPLQRRPCAPPHLASNAYTRQHFPLDHRTDGPRLLQARRLGAAVPRHALARPRHGGHVVRVALLHLRGRRRRPRVADRDGALALRGRAGPRGARGAAKGRDRAVHAGGRQDRALLVPAAERRAARVGARRRGEEDLAAREPAHLAARGERRRVDRRRRARGRAAAGAGRRRRAARRHVQLLRQQHEEGRRDRGHRRARLSAVRAVGRPGARRRAGRGAAAVPRGGPPRRRQPPAVLEPEARGEQRRQPRDALVGLPTGVPGCGGGKGGVGRALPRRDLERHGLASGASACRRPPPHTRHVHHYHHRLIHLHLLHRHLLPALLSSRSTRTTS